MKKIFKLFSLLLAAAMLFSLAACGKSKPTVIGVWQARVEMIEQTASEFDELLGEGSESSLKDYLESFPWDITLTLRDDGTYSIRYDITSEAEAFKTAIIGFTRDAIIQQVGTDLSDEQIEQAIGMSFDDFAQEVLDQMTAVSDTEEQGNYTDKDGVLTWEDGEESPYVLDGDTLSFSVEELGPMTFQRIG